MFARIYRAPLKPGQGEGFAHAIEEKIIPILRKFNGFRDEIAMVSADGNEGIGISFWDRQEDAESYERASYAEVRNILAPFAAGTPELHKYQVTTSTPHTATAKH